MADFEATLKWLDMSQYLERFLQAGFDSWSVLCEITEDDLKVLNVDLGHRRKLQKEIARARNFSQSPTSQYPPHQSVPGATGYSTSTSESQPVPVGKRGYRHHPKPDENAPARPYSAYVMYVTSHLRAESCYGMMRFETHRDLQSSKGDALTLQDRTSLIFGSLAGSPITSEKRSKGKTYLSPRFREWGAIDGSRCFRRKRTFGNKRRPPPGRNTSKIYLHIRELITIGSMNNT